MTKVTFFVYERTGGKIRQTGSYPLEYAYAVAPADDELGVFIGAFPASVEDYTVNVEALEAIPLPHGQDFDIQDYLIARPTYPFPDEATIVADGSDEFVLSGLANPTRVYLDDEVVTVTDGELVITSETPSTYTLLLREWPYLPKTITVTSHAPDA